MDNPKCLSTQPINMPCPSSRIKVLTIIMLFTSKEHQKKYGNSAQKRSSKGDISQLMLKKRKSLRQLT
jgi:hypothetical protein